MRIGALSKKTGVSRDALRLYEQRGLIKADRHQNGYRDYAEHTVQLVGMIKLAQSIGFTLAEIAPEMQAVAAHGLGSQRVAKLLNNKLQEVDLRIENLNSRRNELAQLLQNVCPLKAT